MRRCPANGFQREDPGTSGNTRHPVVTLGSHAVVRTPAGSVAAAFLRYLTDQGGKDILREYGNLPCSGTRYPLVCRPT